MVYLSLSDKIRKICNDISVDDGLDTLVRKIKFLHAKYTNTLAFMAMINLKTSKDLMI